MAVATPYLKKRTPAKSWNLGLQKQNRQFDWRFAHLCTDSPEGEAICRCLELAITTGVFLATWEMVSKPPLPTAVCYISMHFT